jgi:outer membrane cobalamin receptor
MASSLATLALLASPALAAEAIASGDEGTITVTASRTGADIRDLPIAVSVIDAEAIGRQLGQSTDVLRLLDVTVPGLNLSTGGRSQCGTTIRGRTPNFMLNGVPANQDLRPSNCNSAFQLSPVALERVETAQLSLDASSGASIALEGTCAGLAMESSSGASVSAGQLTCRTGTLRAGSGASITVGLTEAVTAKADSGASITVKGSPASTQIEKSISGSVNITR